MHTGSSLLDGQDTLTRVIREALRRFGHKVDRVSDQIGDVFHRLDQIAYSALTHPFETLMVLGVSYMIFAAIYYFFFVDPEVSKAARDEARLKSVARARFEEESYQAWLKDYEARRSQRRQPKSA